jgi:broad specificity phosphatase PhoE
VSGLRLILVRHGITDWNREGRFQGHLDPPLSDLGHRQAALVGARMAAHPLLRPHRVVSSSLARAMQTADAIGAAAEVAVEADPRLIEIGQGEWEGRTHAELEVEDPERYQAWREAGGVRQPPGGEPIATAAARIGSLIEELRADAREEPLTVCLVSHGGSLRIVAQLLLELAGDRSWALDVDNTSIGALARIADLWRLDRWNDTGHLLGTSPTHVDEAEGRPLAL